MHRPALLILAAGLGSRYGGLKQVEGFGPAGETLLEYAVHDAARAGFGRAVCVLRADFVDRFREEVLPRLRSKLETEIVLQGMDDLPVGFRMPEGRVKPWGTGHAVWVARQALAEPFAVINADDFYGPEAYAEAARFLRLSQPGSKPWRWAMVAYRLAQTVPEAGKVSRGICQRGPESRIERISECTGIGYAEGRIEGVDESGVRRELDPQALVSMNLFGFTPEVFTHLEEGLIRFLRQSGSVLGAEFFLPQAVTEAIGSGRATVDVLTTSERWHGVTHPEDRVRLRQVLRDMVATGRYRTPL